MLVARKYRLYPTQQQIALFEDTLETCRRTWNFLLNQRKERREKNRKEQYHSIFEQKQKNQYLKAVYSHVSQNVADRLDKSFKAFFKGIARYPRFKKFGRYDSFTYPDAYNGSVKLGSALRKTKLYLSKIGYVSVVVHRDIPSGTNKTCTIKREADKWFAVLVYQVQDVVSKIVVPKNPVGIDLGLISLVTTSRDEHFDAPKPLQKNLKRLKHLQRSLSRKVGAKKGQKKSNNYRKAQSRLANLHWKIGMQRRDALHKLTYRIANKCDFVSVEDLQICNMLKNHSLARSISDASWGTILQMLQYKVERRGNRFVKVPPQYTSTTCSHCGLRKKSMPLSVRVFVCEHCGYTTDRDTNASQKIEKLGLVKSEVKPMESGVQHFGVQPLVEVGIEAASLQRAV